MKVNFGIGQKILVVVVAILILFAIGLSVVIGTTSFNNLTAIKQAELKRTSQILANRIAEMQEDGVLIVRSFEENEQIVSEIKLLTNLGPYYADPGSYFADDFMSPGALIENADQVYAFQAQLNLIQLLQSVQQLNNLTSISFYLLSPFDIVSEAKPVLTFRLDQDAIFVTQFAHKGDISQHKIYQVLPDQFRPPAPDYFDISSAYSTPVEAFYAENHFVKTGSVEAEFFAQDWQKTDPPRSQVIIKDGVPVIQTWYPVKVPLAHPETWTEETIPVGLAIVEQSLDAQVIALLRDQLGLDVGLVRDGQLLMTSLDGAAVESGANLAAGEIIRLNQDEFYYAQESIDFSGPVAANLEAVVFSPVSELTWLTQKLRLQIGLASIVAIVLTSVIVYVGIQYLVSRPLKGLMQGVQLISAGNLTQAVPVRSRDELGQLAVAFNDMTEKLRQTMVQLRELVDSLEQRVAARTYHLETVAAVSEHLSGILHLEELMAEVVNQVKEKFGYYHAHIYLLDEEQRDLVVVAGTGPAGEEMKAKGHHIPLDAPASLVARAARRNEIVSVENVREAEDWLPNPLLPETRSEMAVPILLEGRVVGVLDVQEDKISGLDEGDENLLRSLANQVAVAMRNAHLFEQVEAALAEAHAAQEHYVEQVWQKTEIAPRYGQHLYARPGAAPLDEAKRQRLAEVRRQALEEDQAVVVTLEGDRAQQKSLVAPITLRNKTIGTLQLHTGRADQVWDDDDLAVIEAVVDQLAQTAENLRLFDETRGQARREQTIREITDKMRAATSLEQLIRTTTTELGERLAAGHALVEFGIETD